MTFAEFAEVFAVLAMQLRATDTSEATAQAYFAVLKDEDLFWVRNSAFGFAQSADFFPKTSTWLNAAQELRRERYRDLKECLTDAHRMGKFLCNKCEDTQWIRDLQTDQVSQCSCAKERADVVAGRKELPAWIE